MIYPAFVGGSYQSQAATAAQERTVNWYVERIDTLGASSQAALYPIPGVEEIADAYWSPGRAHFFMDGREFAIIGKKVVELKENGNILWRANVEADDRPATISSNGDGGGQLFITSGGNGYCYDLATNVQTQITALDGKASMGAHVDGYFLALDADNNTLYISALLNGLSWTPGTDFAQRSIAPDPWKSMRVLGRYVFLLGEQTSEIWYNTGATFPFAPHPAGSLIPYGIAAPFSAIVMEQSLIWLGTSQSGGVRVMASAGFSPEIISNAPIQEAISGYTHISNARADAHIDRGHSFYLLHFRDEHITWAWDAETRLWAERGTWDAVKNRYDAHRIQHHIWAYDEYRALDSQSGSIYRVSPSVSTDADGLLIRCLRRAPALGTENQRLFYRDFELDLEPGLGLVTGQGDDPQVMLRMSNDGGKTWGPEHMRSAGKIGEYSRRVRWDRLGSARRRVFEVSVSDPIPWRITNAYINFAQQPSEREQQPQQQQQRAR